MELELLNSPFAEKDDIDIVVYLCDGQGFKMTIDPLANAQTLVEIVSEELHLEIPTIENVMAIWMVSPLIEIQLKPLHIPYAIRMNWKKLLKRFTYAPENIIENDDPLILFKRNIYLSPYIEKDIDQTGILKLLFDEVLQNFQKHIYRCDEETLITLASLCLFIRNYGSKLDFNSKNERQFVNQIPEFQEYLNCPRSKWINLFKKSNEASITAKIILEFQNLLMNKQIYNLIQLYQKFISISQTITLYGSAFFDAQIEKCKIKGCQDTLCPVKVALNTNLLSVLDGVDNTILMTYPYSDISWESAKIEMPYTNKSSPALFIQIRNDNVSQQPACENRVFILYAKQAPLMDAIISTNIETLGLDSAQTEDDMVDHGSGKHKLVCTFSPKLNEYVCFNVDFSGQIIGDE